MEEISDEVWDTLTPEQQDVYNERIDADNEYEKAKKHYDESMSLKGPFVLAIMGFIFGTFGLGLGAFLFIGALCVIIAIIWAIIRLTSRSQAYMRYKDAKDSLKKLKEN
jgi:hypothetical protein